MGDMLLTMRSMGKVIPVRRKLGQELYLSEDYDDDDDDSCGDDCDCSSCLWCRCCDDYYENCRCTHDAYESCENCVCCEEREIDCDCDHDLRSYCEEG